MAVPSWKQAILDKRRKQEEEEQRKKKDEEAKLSAIPAWKRSILQRKDEIKTPGQKSSVAKAAFNLKASAMKPQERTTPSDSKAKPSSEHSTAKPTASKRNVDETSHLKAKMANGGAVVEKSSSSNTATPPWGKASLRRTASGDSALRNASPQGHMKRWPVVQPPITLARASSSPRNTKRENVVEVGVSEATTPSEDSPTLHQRKETYQSKVAKASPSPTKQRKMNKTSPLLKEKKSQAEDPSPSKKPGRIVKRGSVKSLMGFFQTGSTSESKAMVNSNTSATLGTVNKHTERQDRDTKPTQNFKTETETVSSVTEVTTVTSSTTQMPKTASTVSSQTTSSASPPAALSPVGFSSERSSFAEVSNFSGTSVVELTSSQEPKMEAQLSDVTSAALKEQSVDKPVQPSQMNGTEKSNGSVKPNTLESAVSNAIVLDEKAVDLVQTNPTTNQEMASSATHTPLSNGSVTQWEEEEEAEELTITSIDDDMDSDEAEDQSHEKKSVKNDTSSPLLSAEIKTTQEQSTDVQPQSADLLSVNSSFVHERRSSATLEPEKRADVSAVIGDARADTASTGAQDRDSESKEILRKSSLVDRTKSRKQSRRVSFNEDQLEVEYVYPKPIYEEDECSPTLVRRPMTTDIDETDSVALAVTEQRNREQQTGLALPPHPILKPKQNAGSPSSFLFGGTLHSYQPQSSGYNHLQGTLEKKKKKGKEKKSRKEEPKPPDSPIDYSKLNEETAAMLW